MPALAPATSLERDREITVNCGTRQRIAQAIARARDGDTIRVRGACTETLRIEKRVTLDGGGTAKLSPASASDSTITVDARGVEIRGMLLESPALIQVALVDGATATLERNTVRNATAFGVSASGNSFAVLLGNTIRDNSSGVVATFGAGLRIGVRQFLDTPSPNVIANNLGTGSVLAGNGILIADNASASIVGGNRIAGNNRGVVVALSGHAQIAGNEITDNQIGIFTTSNASVLLPFAVSDNPLFTALNSGVNTQFGIACRGGTISGVPEGLAPAVRLPPVPNTGILDGPPAGLATFCLDQTEARPVPAPGS